MSPGILIMAKAPRPGEAKTRLEPLLGPDGCARLQAQLIRHTAAWSVKAAPYVSMAFASRRAGSELAALVPAGARLFPQAPGHLGNRLRDATDRVFAAREGALIVIGIDSPMLGPEHVAAAARELAGGSDACLVPAFDGGYALIALARPAPAAFSIPPAAWGGPEVLRLTLAALEGAGLRTSILDPVADLDTPADALALEAHSDCPSAVRAALTMTAREAA